MREFTEEVLRKGLVARWFFIRYADPDLHIRRDFRDQPDDLLAGLLPWLSVWSQSLIETGLLPKQTVGSDGQENQVVGPAPA